MSDTKVSKCFLWAICGAFLLVMPAMAAINTINQGNTVFLGEQNLDISGAMGTDTQIGWWAPGSAIATSTPANQMQVTPTSFSVTPSLFSSYTGVWYRLTSDGKADGTAFVVSDPSLDLRVEDTTTNVDETNGWVPRGDQVAFRIDTNLNIISSQRGTSVPVTIKVKAPDGGLYSALIDSSGTTHSIENIGVTSSSYNTGSIWDTGNSVYAVGTYTIWSECNANSMKDNYPVSGKTMSPQTSLLDQDQNPLISVNVPTTSATTQVTTVVTTTQKPTTTVTTVITTQVPKTTATTTAPAVTTALTLSPTTPVTTLAESVPTTVPGFGVVLSLMSLCAVGLLVLKKEN